MEYLVRSEELGKIIELSARRVNQLAKEGIIQKDQSGKFDLRKAVPLYMKYIDKNDTLKREKTMHEKIKREKASLELKLMKNELHKSEDVEAVMTDMLSRCRAKLLGIPSKVAPFVIGYNEIGKIQAVIQKHIEEALIELSDYNPEMFMSKEAKESQI